MSTKPYTPRDEREFANLKLEFDESTNAQLDFLIEATAHLRVPAGYTAEELERDSPYNQWMYE